MATAHHLPLRDRVALVHRVDPQPAGPAARIGLAPLANAHRRGARLGVMHVVFAISPGAPQVVDVGSRDRGQSLIVGLAVDLEFALQNTTHGRAREAFVRRVDGGQRAISSDV